jgi:hypothetical protein
VADNDEHVNWETVKKFPTYASALREIERLQMSTNADIAPMSENADMTVARLRELDSRLTHFVSATVDRSCPICDAEDEIERLRAENTRLASFLHPVGATIRYDGIKDMTSEQVDQMLKAIRETHRG